MTDDNVECSALQASASSGGSLKLTFSDLLPGDVLLYRPRRPNAVQKKISSATNSPYTHAAIYLGKNEIAESVAWPRLIGVRKYALEKSMKGSQCIGVLRTQLGFGGNRPDRLNAFIDDVLKGKKFYNVIAAYNFERDSKDYFDSQLEFIRANYGNVTSHEKFAEMSFFCSGLVVACYSVVEIIGPNAQVAYLPEVISPAGLYRDPTFGWLLGYLLPEEGEIPSDDPLLVETTLWRDCPGAGWWPRSATTTNVGPQA